MRKSDIEKTADELESDSCFELLGTCNHRIATVEAKLAALREQAKPMTWSSVEERTNCESQRYANGELLGLAYMQGALEAHCRIKSDLAALQRQHEAIQEEAQDLVEARRLDELAREESLAQQQDRERNR